MNPLRQEECLARGAATNAMLNPLGHSELGITFFFVSEILNTDLIVESAREQRFTAKILCS